MTMIELTPGQAQHLRAWFVPDQPGPLVGLHVLHTGHGVCLVDRWPDPKAVLIDCAGNYALRGDPAAVDRTTLAQHIAGFVDTSQPWVPVLQAAFPGMVVWERVMFDLQSPPRLVQPSGFTPPRLVQPSGFTLRRLGATDGDHLHALSAEVAWVSKTWGGVAGLLAGGTSWGAFVAGRLVAVACSFFVGDQYEDVGVATEPAFRGHQLGPACAAAVCADIQARGRRPSWTTSPDNPASIRVAHKLGFASRRRDRLFVIGTAIPQPPAAGS